MSRRDHLAVSTQLPLQLRRGDIVDDIVVMLEPSLTLGELGERLGLGPTTYLNHERVRDDMVKERAVSRLAAGDVLADRCGGAFPPQTGELQMSVVAGPDSGASVGLGAGSSYRVGDRLLAVGEPELGPLPWHDRSPMIETIDMGSRVIAIGPPSAPDAAPRTRLLRPPRPPRARAVRPIADLAVPPAVADPPPLSWAMILAPLPIALAMAIFFRPIFALFAIVGPFVGIGRWYESRRRAIRDRRRRVVLIHAQRERLVAARSTQAAALRKERWEANPSVPELLRRAQHRSVRLWERRIDHDDALNVILGVGPDHAVPVLTSAVPRESTEVRDLLEAPIELAPVPHVLDLGAIDGVGVVGTRAAAVALVRSLVLQLATHHGPSDIHIGVATAEGRADDWDWLKWLPHLDPSWVTVGASQANGVEFPTPAAPVANSVHPALILVVDDETFDVAGALRHGAETGREIRVVACAANVTGLPACCQTIVDVDACNGAVTLTGVSLATAHRWARSLAAMVDPDVDGSTAQGGELDLASLHLAGHVVDRWARSEPEQLTMRLGSCAGEPVELDLVSDGPHVLIAGTTGSGKSELLRTIVLSLAAHTPPDQLHIALVDFKGGGAFDALADLPHVVGLLTDLDEHLVDRVLVAIGAEIRDREQTMREGAGELARLVIVIDEFAVLAREYPDAMARLIDVAARGRSLGVHVILATQKPSGVVDHRIRANTNLRIALRMQSAHESHDVVDTPDAASIDRRCPGRAIVRIGNDATQTIQVASGATAPCAETGPMTVPHRLTSMADSLVAPSAGQAVTVADGPARPSTLELLVDEISATSAAGQWQLPPTLWAPPLPLRIDWNQLVECSAPMDRRQLSIPIGLLDRPEVREHQLLTWLPEEAGLVVFAQDPAVRAQVMGCVAAGFVLAEPADRAHVHVIARSLGVDPDELWLQLDAVGSRMQPGASDRFERVVAHAELVLERRRQGASEPRTLVVIDTIGQVLEGFDDLARLSLISRLESIARDGPSLAVHLAIGASSVREVPHRLGQHLGHRILGRLADPSGHLVLGAERPSGPSAMHVRDLASGARALLADAPDPSCLLVPPVSNPDALPAEILGPPTRVLLDDLPAATFVDSVLHVPVGMPLYGGPEVSLHLGPGDHALVVGSVGSGRSTVLSTIAHQAASMTDRGVYFLDSGRPSLQAMPHASQLCDLADFERLLADSDHGTGAAVLVVDDIERLSTELAQRVAELVQSGETGYHVIVSTTSDALRSSGAWCRALRPIKTAVLTRPAPLDGDVVGVRRVEIPGAATVAGRGAVIDRGKVSAVQLATVL